MANNRLRLAMLGKYYMYSKTCLTLPFKKKTKMCFQDRLSLNAGQKYCRMLQGEHSAILSTFIKLPFVIKIFLFCLFVAHLSHWLRVSYCDHWMSVVRRVSSVVNNCFKRHLLLNYWLNFDQTW